MVTDRDDGMLLAAVIVVAGLIVGLVAWAGVRDRAGLLELEVRSAHPPLTLPTTSVTTLVSDDAWHGWRHDLFWQALAAEPKPEVDVSSITIERQPSGELVVTNPPEAPIAVVPQGELEELICSVSWDCGTALRVARCESRLDPGAVGRAGERGLFQVHPVHAAGLGDRWEALFDPAVNVAVAYEMWQSQGWRPWTCAGGAR